MTPGATDQAADGPYSFVCLECGWHVIDAAAPPSRCPNDGSELEPYTVEDN